MLDSESHNPSAPVAPTEPDHTRTDPRESSAYAGPLITATPAPEFIPHILALEDELARSRKREAFWISLVVHMVVILIVIFSPDLLPHWAQPHLLRLDDLGKSNPTFITLPHDQQKPPRKVHSNKLSDKNRIAETPHPRIDRKTLEALRAAAPPPGEPIAPIPPARAVAPAPSPEPGGAHEKSAPPASVPPPQHNTIQIPKVAPQPAPQPQPKENPFKSPGSAGSMIAEATRGAFPRFPQGEGGYGSYGTGPADRNAALGPFDILSDTQGVDFGPYLARVLESIKSNWYNLVPEEARPPLLKHGRVAIRFLITPSGKVAGMYVEQPSGDVPLDRAAYGGITASDPFSPLPHEFHGPYLALRITFFYNPTPGEMEKEEQRPQ